MFHQTVQVILILVIYITHVNSSVSLSGRLKIKETRPRYPDQYRDCPEEICDRANDYPYEKIANAMRNKKSLQSIMGPVLESSYNILDFDARSAIPFGEPKSLCRVEGPIPHKPLVMRNVDLEWKFVVNVEGYEQIFNTESCRNNSKSELFWNVNFACEQSYQEIYLLVFEDGFIDFDKFKIPTFCSSVCV